ncbi:MAG TPA: hypothetical protein EYH45_03435 [Candidatus Caldiarchaeum subterraneum]|uniref:DNA primase small subunit PriS n=1 Tax=Caldiarchaeum subterraneum TaxID=311458 RepID=A0A833E9M6_CALS0|nr:hypothetical protein [Candidatus Caldarchaeum subterraneum]
MNNDKKRSLEFVRGLFRNYYEAMGNKIYQPSKFENREFGYMPFHQKIMIRHLRFRNLDELLKVLKREAPMHVYRSAAIYHLPTAPMEEKGWLGAELIFDIDADHLELPCKKEHDFNYCNSCFEILKPDEEICMNCNSGEITEVEWVCGKCITAARDELLKLLSFLEGDFGLNPDNMTITFSGNRGYHVAVHEDKILRLNREARQEIAEYITASHLDIKAYGLSENLRPLHDLPDYIDPGWKGRIAKSTYQILARINSGDEETINKLKETLPEENIQNLGELLYEWSEKPQWSLLNLKTHSRGGKRINQLSVLVSLALQISRSQIDTVVTTDIHRLLRLANTLNGKTGLLAGVIKYDSIEDIEPFEQFLVLPKTPEVKVKVVNAPEFQLGGRRYGPYSREVVKLPANIAAYLICKETAILAS